MKISIRCFVYPTEEQRRVEKALIHLFPSADFIYNNAVQPELRTESSEKNILDSVRNSIYEIRIIDAARSRLLFNWDGKQTRICFDKQAAFIGKLKLIDDSEESPSLGFIEVQLDFEASQGFEQFLDWFSPSTKEKRRCHIRP